MKINIAFIIDELSIGGTEKQLVELVNRLNRFYFKPKVYVLRAGNSDKSLINKLDCDIGIVNFNNFLSLASIRNYVRFLKELKSRDHDIIQLFFPESCFLGSIAGKYAGIRVIISSRRDIGTWHRSLNKIFILLSNILVNRILVNSLSVRNYVIEEEGFKANNIDIIYNGINVDHFKYIKDINDKSTKGLTVGIIANFKRPVKRFDIFTGAMNLIVRDFQDIKVLVIGELPENYKKYIPNDLINRYQFSGTTIDVRSALTKMDIGVLTSDSEGFSNVILEYMAAGMATVCTKSGGNIEIIEDGVDGLFFTQGDYQDLYTKLKYLILNNNIRYRLGNNAKEKITKTFDWSQIITEYERYYTSLV